MVKLLKFKFIFTMIWFAFINADQDETTTKFPSEIIQEDILTEQKYEMNGFVAAEEVEKLSYTSGRVLKPVYNTYDRSSRSFKIFAYYTDWSQYDGRLDGNFEDANCGRGIDLMKLDATAYDKLIIGFAGIVGDEGEKKETIKSQGELFGFTENHQVTFTDYWGDVQSYRNCGFTEADSDAAFSQEKTTGVLGGLRKLKEANPKLILAFSIGGYTMSQAFHFTSAKPESRRIFCQSVVSILQLFPMFTELDLDWELPNAESAPGNVYDETDVVNYQQLILDLIAATKAVRPELIISVACAGSVEKLQRADIGGLYKAGVKGFNLMTYDYFGSPWADGLGHHTNLRDNGENNGWSVEKVVDYALSQGIPSELIYIGYAGYSRNAKNAEISCYSPLRGVYKPGDGTTTGSFESSVTEVYDLLYNYLDLEKQQGRNGFELFTDDRADADYLYNCKSKLFMSIETPRSVYAKARYVVENKLGGLFTWVADSDKGILVNAAQEGLGFPIENEVIDMKRFYFKGNAGN